MLQASLEEAAHGVCLDLNWVLMPKVNDVTELNLRALCTST